MQRTICQGGQISPLFHEDGQGEQLINLIIVDERHGGESAA
jgi:hypothetical protein